MDHLSRINVAIAYPEIFLRPGFNVFLQDAELQVRRYNPSLRNPVPFTETRHSRHRPLLWAAIENDVDIQVIEELLNTYMSVCPTSVDGIWGEYFTAYSPPLTFAAGMGKPQVVSLLLRKGADPLRHCMNYTFPSYFLVNRNCKLEATNHAQCECYHPPINPESDSDETACLTPMMAAIAKGLRLRSEGNLQAQAQVQALEECALILYSKGVPLPLANEATLNRVIKRTVNLTRAGFCRLASAILDPLISLKPGDPALRFALYRLLLDACWYQPSDDDIATIEYLLSIGAPLVPESNHYLNTPIHISYLRGHLKTATYLVNRHADQELSLDYQELSLLASKDTLTFVQALFRAMGKGTNSYCGTEVPTQTLHSILLKEAVDAKDQPAIEWLSEQGCTMPTTDNELQ
ncbi:hypothetical protein F5B18DRAFT_605535 [Nemania serpens]|nr:hypothetical protein F5B18DRAFT_605535 [Nemania serpens]